MQKWDFYQNGTYKVTRVPQTCLFTFFIKGLLKVSFCRGEGGGICRQYDSLVGLNNYRILTFMDRRPVRKTSSIGKGFSSKLAS